MEENRVNNEVGEDIVEVEITENSGMSNGLAMLIGGCITVAAIAGGKALKKAIAKRKAKKENSDVIDVEAKETDVDPDEE